MESKIACVLPVNETKPSVAIKDELYAAWTKHHRPIYTRTACLVGIAVMAILISIDFANFGTEQALNYVFYRSAFMIYLLANLAMIYRDKLSFVKSKRNDGVLMPILLFTPPFICNLLYIYFLLTVPIAHHAPVILGNLMVIFFSGFLLHCFWKEQLTLHALSILTLLVVGAIFPLFRSDAIQLIICHISSFVVLHFFRKKFFNDMLERYVSMRAMMPAVVAKRMTVIDADISTDEAFRPRKRYAAFLSSDWRNYQELATKTSAENVSKLFETYYDIVFAELEKTVPSGTYYADWTADELSIIFYSDEDDSSKVLRDATAFAWSLATTIPAMVHRECGIPLVFDIGVASGFGILGLQGPRQRKKTTITADFAGTAKRLETEAKELRSVANDKNSNPIIIMDEATRGVASQFGLFTEKYGSKVIAKTKNISGQTFFKWQMPQAAFAKVIPIAQAAKVDPLKMGSDESKIADVIAS
jgi:hypothetical protein